MKKFAIIALTALTLGGCQATLQKAELATGSAVDKANKALDFVCTNYPAVDAAFAIAVVIAGDKIPKSVIETEQEAVDWLQATCTNRPTDVVSAAKTARSLYDKILDIRIKFKKA